jgi:hypothetical protein
MAAQSISFELIMRVREFYAMAYQEISLDKRKQVIHDNGITDYAVPSYILSVASVESFINEIFLAIGPNFFKDSSLVKLPQNKFRSFRRKSLKYKLLELPNLAFDQEVFKRGEQPFQDMSYLIDLRNSFVHYKMEIDPENKETFDYLVMSGIALNSPDGVNRFWASDLSTIEGIRWAHNTVLKIINSIIDVAIKTNRHPILISLGTQTKNFFYQIPSPTEQGLWSSWMNAHTKWVKSGQ